MNAGFYLIIRLKNYIQPPLFFDGNEAGLKENECH